MNEEPVVQVVGRMDRDQHDRLSNLLADFEREHGPIDPQVMEEVRREWHVPKKKTVACRVTEPGAGTVIALARKTEERRVASPFRKLSGARFCRCSNLPRLLCMSRSEETPHGVPRGRLYIGWPRCRDVRQLG
jgi:hypothetical protein